MLCEYLDVQYVWYVLGGGSKSRMHATAMLDNRVSLGLDIEHSYFRQTYESILSFQFKSNVAQARSLALATS